MKMRHLSKRRQCNQWTGAKTFEQSVEDFWIGVESSDIGYPLKCWNWLGYRNTARKGYGIASFQGKQIGAHRASYLVHFGAIPCGLFVCHRCDNPACVNPNHLFLGTNQDNMRDCADKGRLGGAVVAPKLGELNSQSKLKESDVVVILRSGKRRRKELAKEFGVSESTIKAIRCGGLWAYIPR